MGLDQVREAEVDSVRDVFRGSEPQQDRIQHEFSPRAGRQRAAHQHLHGQRGGSAGSGQPGPDGLTVESV